MYVCMLLVPVVDERSQCSPCFPCPAHYAGNTDAAVRVLASMLTLAFGVCCTAARVVFATLGVLVLACYAMLPVLVEERYDTIRR